MGNVTERAKVLYNEFPFGQFCYADQRASKNPHLLEFVRAANKKGYIYDIGCGAGYWLRIYRSLGFEMNHIHGVDLAPENARVLSAEGFEVIQADILNLPIPDEVSDYTVASGVIHHTQDSLQAFRELCRITKKSGRLFVNVYNAYHPYYYIVHKLTRPFRFLYWNVARPSGWIIYPFYYVPLQIGAWLIFGRWLDRNTARTSFMDQVMTPRAELFTARKLVRYANSCSRKVIEVRYNKAGLMISAIVE